MSGSNSTLPASASSSFPPQAQASHEAGPSNYAKANGYQIKTEGDFVADTDAVQTGEQLVLKETGQAAYPTPSAEEVETTLPPWQSHNPPISLVTERFIKGQYWELQHLLRERLPYIPPRDRSKPLIHYAKATRQSTLKLLALLRWKSTIDVGPGLLSLPTNHPPSFHSFANGFGEPQGEDQQPSLAELNKGRLSDVSRVTTLMEYYIDHFKQNVLHLENVGRQVDSLRIRNADILSAIDIHASGTYTRLPSSLTDFIPPPPLTNKEIVAILHKLDTHLRYRLRALEYIPPDLVIEKIKDGKAHFRHRYGGWTCALTVLGFGLGPDGQKDSWCLLAVDFGVSMARDEKLDGEGDDLKDLVEATMNVEMRDEIIRMAGMVLQPVAELSGEGAENVEEVGVMAKVDAPLARVCNLLQTISLAYQIEVLHNQALRLAAFAWRDSLRIEMAKDRKSLRVDYWVRPRPVARPAPAASSVPQPPLVGGSIHFRIGAKVPSPTDSIDAEMEGLLNGDLEPTERAVRTAISVRWGAADSNWLSMPVHLGFEDLALEVDPSRLDIEYFILYFTRLHAERLTRALSAAMISNTRAASVFEHNGEVSLVESASSVDPPVVIHIPLPSNNVELRPNLVVFVSHRTGTIDLREDGVDAAGPARKQRIKQAIGTVNQQPSKILEVVWRLTAAIIMDTLQAQLVQLGWNPTRRIGLRLPELAKAGLQGSSSLYVQLPSSPLHYLVTTMHKTAFRFGLLQLRSIPAESGVGTRLAVGDLGWLNLEKILGDRLKNQAETLGKRKRGGARSNGAVQAESGFTMSPQELRDIYGYCNARVAHLKVEQQFKDRGIPYTLVFPPPSSDDATAAKRSEVTHLIPSFCVNAKDLLKDGRAVDVAMPNVAMQIRGWWRSGPCQVVTSVKLRHQPPLRTTAGSPAAGGPSTLQSTNISFDPTTSVVSFLSDDLERCLVTFLEQWERLSKVIVVAGEVNRVNKDARLADVQMLSFDLKTASFTYSPGYATSITYTPASDSYDASFFCTELAGDEAHAESKINPHDAYAPLWSDKLNELASMPDAQGRTCSRFVGLLRHSLPLLNELNKIAASPAAQPRLVVRSVANYRLVWDASKTRRHAIDIILQPVSGYFFLHDATTPLHAPFIDTSCGVLTPFDDFKSIATTAFEAVRDARNGESWESECPPLVKLQGDSTLLCHASYITDTLQALIRGIDTAVIN